MIHPTYTEPGFNAAALALSHARRTVFFYRHVFERWPTTANLARLAKARLRALHCENIVIFKLYRVKLVGAFVS